jgi:hypothetical protein
MQPVLQFLNVCLSKCQVIQKVECRAPVVRMNGLKLRCKNGGYLAHLLMQLEQLGFDLVKGLVHRGPVRHRRYPPTIVKKEIRLDMNRKNKRFFENKAKRYLLCHKSIRINLCT